MTESPQHESFPYEWKDERGPKPSTTKKLTKYKAMEAGSCSSNQPLVFPTELIKMYKWKSIIDISTILQVVEFHNILVSHTREINEVEEK